MARSRRRVFGRALALLILGIVLAVSLFLARHLRPSAIKAQVREALAERIAAPFDFDDVILDLDRGVELIGLRIYYGDGTPAVEVERMLLTVDHQKLLSGRVIIRQVDIAGLIVRLRKDQSGTPGLPGVLSPQEDPTAPVPPPPLIRITGGKNGTRVEIHDLDAVRDGAPVILHCDHAEGHPDQRQYTVSGVFSGKLLERLTLRIAFDKADGTMRIDAEAQNLHWTRDTWKALSPSLRASLPPLELAGRASAKAALRFRLGPWRLDHCFVDSNITDLGGAFGNIHTGEAVGLPFRLREGAAHLVYDNGLITMDQFSARYISPADQEGHLTATLGVDLRRRDPHVDLHMVAQDIHAETADLRNLLPPNVVDDVVESFLPAGVFEFDLHISERPGIGERVHLDLRLDEGKVNYAGQFDELTGKRFGFRYPVSRCKGHLVIDTGVPTPHGPADRVSIHNLTGFNPIARPQPGGPTDVRLVANGEVVSYDHSPDGSNREDVKIDIAVANLPIDAKLASAFASTPRGMPYEKFALTGWAERVDIRVRRDAFGDNQARASYDVILTDCAMAYESFPIRIRGIQGRIVSKELAPDKNGVAWRTLQMIDLRGETADGGNVIGNGEVRQDDRGTETLQLNIDIKELALGEDLKRALRDSPVIGDELRRLWKRLDPQGSVNANVTFASPTDPRIRIDLAGTTDFMGFRDIDLELTNVKGEVSFRDDIVKLHGIAGESLGTKFVLGGKILNTGEFELDAAVTNLRFDKRARALLREFASHRVERIEALGISEDSKFDVVLKATRQDLASPIEIATHLARLHVKMTALGLPLEIEGGPLDISDTLLTGKNLWVRSGEGEVHVFEISMPPSGFGDIRARLSAKNIHPKDHLEALFGPGLGPILGHNLRLDMEEMEFDLIAKSRLLRVRGEVDLRRHALLNRPPDALEPTGHVQCDPILLRLPEKRGDPVEFSGILHYTGLNMNLPVDARDMSGELRIGTATLAPEFSLKGAVHDGKVTVMDRAISSLSLNLEYVADYLRLGNLNGSFYQGILRGDIEVHLGDPGAFRVRMRASDVELGEMLKQDLPRDANMSGSLEAAIEFESVSGELEDMKGRGEVRVKEGQLFAVPGIRRFLAVLARAAPLEGPRFERAEVDFRIEGESILIDKLHVADNLNDIYGRGTVSIYGDLDLVIEPQVTRLLDLPRFINLPLLSTLRDLWHRTAYEIRMRGTIDSPALKLRALPFLRRTRKPFTQSPHAGRTRRVRPRVLPR